MASFLVTTYETGPSLLVVATLLPGSQLSDENKTKLESGNKEEIDFSHFFLKKQWYTKNKKLLSW